MEEVQMIADSKRPVAVVGGGLGGLASACTLAARGHRVVLFERNNWLGGKAAVLSAEGFRFDMGPTILTLPRVLERIFSEAGKTLTYELQLVRLDPQWRCFYEDGGVLDLTADLPAMRDAIRDFTRSNAASDGYERFLEWSRDLNRISERFFFWRSVGSMGDALSAFDWLKPSVWRDVWTLRLGKSVGECVRADIPDARVAQMIDHFTQYVGSAPDQSPAVLCGIAHMQTNEGVWYPIGGTRAVPVALQSLADELGVDVRLGMGVRRIVIEHGRAVAVETDSGERVDVAAVISNCDSVRTHRELLPESESARGRFERRREYEPACSGVVLYLGLNRRYDELLHHNFVFSTDPHEEFDFIYQKGEPAPDPTCYVCAAARSEPGVAPPGGDAIYVLVHTPYLRPHHDWSEMLPVYRKTILGKLAKTAGLKEIEKHIVYESALTPQDIHTRFHVLNGAIYGLASHGKVNGAFKPANRSPDIQRLYLCGGSAHPGPGMPMVLMSGWIAADVAARDLAASDLADL
jgi:phytoene desaturase